MNTKFKSSTSSIGVPDRALFLMNKLNTQSNSLKPPRLGRSGRGTLLRLAAFVRSQYKVQVTTASGCPDTEGVLATRGSVLKIPFDTPESPAVNDRKILSSAASQRLRVSRRMRKAAFSCPNCQNLLREDEKLDGNQVRCPKCGELVPCPEPQQIGDQISLLRGSPICKTTQWGDVLAARENSGPARERLCRTYWYPVYAYVRRRGLSPHDAQDLTQDAFAGLLTDKLRYVDPTKGKFRSWLFACVNQTLADAWRRSSAEKRGGGQCTLSRDAEAAEGRYLQEPVDDMDPAKLFDLRWVDTVLAAALDRLKAEYVASDKQQLFESLKPFLVGGGEESYAAIEARLGLSNETFKTVVHRARLRWGELLREEISDTLADPSMVDHEMRELFRIARKSV